MNKIVNIKSITEAHRLLGIEKPVHPLISVFKHTPEMNTDITGVRLNFDMYFISLKVGIKGAVTYGKNRYDFDEGSLVFTAPNQIIEVTEKPQLDFSGWSIFFHPDLLRQSSLTTPISKYSFFNYSVNEALHVSDKEKKSLTEVIDKIKSEINQNIDKHSQDLIIHNLESILKYSSRYYDRQFLTRTNYNQDFIVRFETYLNEYFTSNQPIEKGIPSVTQCGKALNMSGHYLSDMLKVETGKTAKEYIHLLLIDKAKTKLLNSDISIKALAYDLGFNYPQNFSKLFKNKTGVSPKDYRGLN